MLGNRLNNTVEKHVLIPDKASNGEEDVHQRKGDSSVKEDDQQRQGGQQRKGDSSVMEDADQCAGTCSSSCRKKGNWEEDAFPVVQKDAVQRAPTSVCGQNLINTVEKAGIITVNTCNGEEKVAFPVVQEDAHQYSPFSMCGLSGDAAEVNNVRVSLNSDAGEMLTVSEGKEFPGSPFMDYGCSPKRVIQEVVLNNFADGKAVTKKKKKYTSTFDSIKEIKVWK